MYDILIKNAAIHTGRQSLHGDIAIANGRIAAIAPVINAEAGRILDASGLIALPGGVDAHTHFGLRQGENQTCDGYAKGSAAALAGGVTAFIEHIGFGPESCPPGLPLQTAMAEAEGQSLIDYGFHGVLQNAEPATLNALDALPEAGVSSLKAYMTYAYALEATALLPVFRRCRELSLLLTVHAEDDAMLVSARDGLRVAGRLHPRWYAQSRPPASEALAIEKLLLAAHKAGDAPVYIVHLSTAAGLDKIRAARRRGQQNIFVETCPQYLLLDEALYAGERAENAVMSPPLRGAADREALWQGISAGEIEVVATDHCAFSHAQKQQGREDFTLCPGGASGAGERLSLLWSEGVIAGRITPQRFVEINCLNPARLFGLYPRKGQISAGADADLLLLNPKAETVPDGGYDSGLYGGMRLKCGVHSVIAGGKIAMSGGRVLAMAGDGQYLRR